jgi:hypothetical protein
LCQAIACYTDANDLSCFVVGPVVADVILFAVLFAVLFVVDARLPSSRFLSLYSTPLRPLTLYRLAPGLAESK